MNDPDFETLSDAWVHLTPWQKKILTWRAILLSIRTRAFRFIQRITGGESDDNNP